MSGKSKGLTKSFVPGAAVAAFRIVKHGTTDNEAIQSAAAANFHIGVSDEMGAASDDDTVDVVTSGVAEVEYGGTVVRGALLTSDSTGRAISTTTANNRIIGIAWASGVVGDIGLVNLNPGIV